MRTLAAVMLTLIEAGCEIVPNGGAAEATIARLERPMTELAGALAGDDIARMRAAGRNVIAIYDAGASG